MNKDQEHLRLLSIFHYIVAAIVALFSCVFILHLVIGIVAIVSPESMAGKDGTSPPPFFGWMFVVLGGLAVFMGWAFAVCLISAGRFLAKRKHYLFCMIIAGLSCFNMPFGTILGVFTIIVLVRPSVKELFNYKPSGQSSSDP